MSISGKLLFRSYGGTISVGKRYIPARIAYIGGTLLRLVFSRLCPLSGISDLVGIVDHISGNVAHVAVPAGNSGFLGN